MTDSMNFGPEWLRNLSSDGTTAGGNTGGGGGGVRYQLAEYRYGREEMLALYEKGLPAPNSLCSFAPLYSETTLPPLALQPHTDEERQWQSRGAPMGPSLRGARGALSAERGGRVPRGRGGYPPYGRTVSGYETGGGNSWGANNGGEQTEWSPRKDFNYTRPSQGGVDNWRRSARTDDEDAWRTTSHLARSAEKISDKWGRSSSWREGEEERVGPQPDKSGRTWHDNQRGPPQRWMRDNDDNLPEWATEHLGEGGGTFDSSGAFHGSDDEQEGKGGTRKDHHLQKSISQQNITASKAQQHTPLSTSKSAISLSKPPEPPANIKDVIKENVAIHINDVGAKTKPPTVMEEKEMRKEPEMMRAPPQKELKSPPGHNTNLGKVGKPMQNQSNTGNRVDEDFDKLQEDLVLKLVVEEEPTKAAPAPPNPPHSNGVIVPPPNMMPPIQEKWYYQDPQGDLQGPFLSTEMAEWFKAGYFSAGLFVRRQCDERFYTLGDLVTLCGDNPFQTSVPIAPLKQEPPPKVTDEILQYHHQMMQAQIAAAAAMRNRSAFAQGEPWSSALGSLQQRELLSQQYYVNQPQVRLPIPTEPFINTPTSGNQLFQMLNHLKMTTPPPPMVVDKTPVGQMDTLQTLVHQMGGMQSRTVPQQQQQQPQQQPPPVTIGGPVPPTMKHEALHGLPMNNGIPGPAVMPGMAPSNSLIGGVPKPQMGKIDGDNNMNFLKFLQKPQMEQSIDLETLWRNNQYTSNQAAANPPIPQPQPPQPQQQWQQEQKPITMWDLPAPSPHPNVNTNSHPPPEAPQMNKEKEPQAQVNNADSVISNNNKEAAKEEKKKREAEEKRLKKEAEEKRKQEQRRAEQEKEKRRKEEERVKKELEKAKRESEEKKAREAAEKRRLKELRKAEAEEARRKAEEEEELRKSEEREKEKLAAKEREEQQKRQAEMIRQNQKLARAAPWSQSVNNQELSLAEIQKLEKERKAAEVAMLQQQQQQQQQQRLLQQQQEQLSPEKPPGSLQLNWANRPSRNNQQVKSLAEIQAEEQERLLKVKATEKAQAKEKETLSPPAARIWQGQTLTWNNNDNSNIGFWDEPQHKPQQNNKPTVTKANPEPKVAKQQQQHVNSVSKQTAVNKTVKVKANKKEEHPTTNNNNASTTDDFTEWCTKTLANMNTPVDIPTFVSFLFDIESALDVREYCRDYLGDRPATQQFAAQFLEKRRLFKPKANAHKDDLCSPAPAITPSTQQHNNNSDFQEVKGKGKKCKKSKMLKVDARILGFNVTAAQDRINVGDRDYGDTT